MSTSNFQWRHDGLILDPVASRYVRLIFELALQGNRTGTIAKILNEKQIPTPAAYHVAENHVYSEQKAWDLQRSHWTSGTVYHILKNEKYICWRVDLLPLQWFCADSTRRMGD